VGNVARWRARGTPAARAVCRLQNSSPPRRRPIRRVPRPTDVGSTGHLPGVLAGLADDRTRAREVGAARHGLGCSVSRSVSVRASRPSPTRAAARRPPKGAARGAGRRRAGDSTPRCAPAAGSDRRPARAAHGRRRAAGAAARRRAAGDEWAAFWVDDDPPTRVVVAICRWKVSVSMSVVGTPPQIS